MNTPSQPPRFVLLDRDGVINTAVRNGYVLAPDAIKILPGAPEAIARLNAAGYRVAVASNQQCVGKGELSEAGLDAITQVVRDRVAAAGGTIEAFFYCRHLASNGCDCRKPKPGLLLQAQRAFGFDLAATYFVGDAYTDLETAANARCPAIFVRSGLDAARYDAGEPFPAPSAAVVADLAEAVDFILRNDACP